MIKKEQKKLHILKYKKVILSIIAISLLFFALLAGVFYFQVEQVTITGCSFYSEEEVEEKIINSKLDRNCLYLYLKYKLGKGISLPFVDEIEVDILSHDAIHINVYEKTMTACIQYMGEYLYFDKDGVVVESATEKIENVPVISGVDFAKMNLHEVLVVEDRSIFNKILDLSQLLSRYKITVDEICFNQKQEVTLAVENIKVTLGKREQYDEPIAELSKLLPKAIQKKLKGTLDMENFQEGQDKIIFKEDKKS